MLLKIADIGLGVFANQEVKAGEILRVGISGYRESCAFLPTRSLLIHES